MLPRQARIATTGNIKIVDVVLSLALAKLLGCKSFKLILIEFPNVDLK
jgi:hypothetical protein